MAKRLAWCEQQRQVWIADMLTVYGFINREHLMRKFLISMPQASKDLNVFLRLYPDLMYYDPSRKCYVAVTDDERRMVEAAATPGSAAPTSRRRD
jgi:hypothetical protein